MPNDVNDNCCGYGHSANGLRRVNEMFHVDREGHLVKSSNGERIPDDEPVFILRGRDALAVGALHRYVNTCKVNGVPPDRVRALRAVLVRFRKYKNKKLPGVTHGR